jgi:hypothetical protein
MQPVNLALNLSEIAKFCALGIAPLVQQDYRVVEIFHNLYTRKTNSFLNLEWQSVSEDTFSQDVWQLASKDKMSLKTVACWQSSIYCLELFHNSSGDLEASLCQEGKKTILISSECIFLEFNGHYEQVTPRLSKTNGLKIYLVTSQADQRVLAQFNASPVKHIKSELKKTVEEVQKLLKKLKRKDNIPRAVFERKEWYPGAVCKISTLDKAGRFEWKGTGRFYLITSHITTGMTGPGDYDVASFRAGSCEFEKSTFPAAFTIPAIEFTEPFGLPPGVGSPSSST